MLSLAHNFLFIHIPKTAGNAIQRALLPFSEDKMLLNAPHQDGVERFEIRSPNVDIIKHSTLADYKKQLAPETFSRLTKFTCIRNPWDRCVSFFFSPHRGQVQWSAELFAEFIRREVEPSHRYLKLEESDGGSAFDNVDVIIRYENLTPDFDSVCQRLGLPRPQLPRVNASERKDYRSYFFNDELIDIVADKFAPEIDVFGYTFD